MISIVPQHFRRETDSRGITTVWIDVKDRPVNVFDDSVIRELEQVIVELAADSNVKAVVFRSAKSSGFFAGADVHEIAALKDRTAVETVITRGHDLFSSIERLAVPTIAAIHGPCLGGGLEFALACRYRIAMDRSDTRLGLPEVQLGLIPGWGGTQRLPKLIGVAKALPLILQGKKLTAAAALKCGLVDGVSAEDQWDKFVVEFAASTITSPNSTRVRVSGTTSRGPRRSWKQKLTELAGKTSLGRWLAFRIAIKQTAREAKNYPALSAALRAVRAAFNNRVDGFLVERNEFADLIETPTCRNLLNLFLWREAARASSSGSRAEPTVMDPVDRMPVTVDRVQGESPNSKPDARIQKIAIIGAGAMGAGIGQLAALKGFDIVLKELNPELAKAGGERVARLLDDMVRKKQLSAAERDQVLHRVTTTDCFDDLSDCDLAIEAVVEKMDIKRMVFANLDAVLKPHAIIVSNTSALSVTEMAKAARPDRVAGLHFFNPVHRMDLVELVRTEETSDVTTATLLKLVKKLGKTPVVTSDSPGFLVNRVLFPYIGEAVRMVIEGFDCRELDREIKRFGMPMGPVELIDHVGIDVAWHVADTLRDVLPESDNVIHLLGEMVARGWTGKKAGRGFYDYSKGHKGAATDLMFVRASAQIKSARSDSAAFTEQSVDEEIGHRNVGTFLPDGLSDIQRRLIYPMINEVGFCLQDGVVAEPWMADLAMILGTGFAPFRGGPMTMADSIGDSQLLNNLNVLNARHGDRYKASAWLVDRRRGKERTLVET